MKTSVPELTLKRKLKISKWNNRKQKLKWNNFIIL